MDREGDTRDLSIQSIRILPELRAVQVERDLHMTRCRTLFLDEKYDLGETRLPPSMTKVTLRRAVIELFCARERILEVPEPLWLRFLPTELILVLAWKIGGLFQGRARETVTYAIENNDVDDIIFGWRKPRNWLRALARLFLRSFVSVAFDRIAFGSEGARNTYDSLRFSSRVLTRQWDELPATSAALERHSSPGSALFVGRLEARKGLHELIAAWADVEKILPHATLTIVGDGELADQVASWSDAKPTTRKWIGQVEHGEVAGLMELNDVLVAPSIRWGRWREQIGLPISEGLGAGLTIVTTSETGLAGWLKENGHEVIDSNMLHIELVPRLVRALQKPLSVDAVVKSLPPVSGRLAADNWLHSPQ